jgi:hypothetical protein
MQGTAAGIEELLSLIGFLGAEGGSQLPAALRLSKELSPDYESKSNNAMWRNHREIVTSV